MTTTGRASRRPGAWSPTPGAYLCGPRRLTPVTKDEKDDPKPNPNPPEKPEKHRTDAADLGLHLGRRGRGDDPMLFRWLVACLLFGARISQERAAAAFAELDRDGVLTPSGSRMPRRAPGRAPRRRRYTRLRRHEGRRAACSADATCWTATTGGCRAARGRDSSRRSPRGSRSSRASARSRPTSSCATPRRLAPLRTAASLAGSTDEDGLGPSAVGAGPVERDERPVRRERR